MLMAPMIDRPTVMMWACNSGSIAMPHAMAMAVIPRQVEACCREATRRSRLMLKRAFLMGVVLVNETKGRILSASKVERCGRAPSSEERCGSGG